MSSLLSPIDRTDSSSSSSSSTSTRSLKAPILIDTLQYSAWKLLMENYLVAKQLDELLSLKLTSIEWSRMVKFIKNDSTKSNSSLLNKMGVTRSSITHIPVVKQEAKNDADDGLYQNLSAGEIKEIHIIYQKVRLLYSIIYDVIPEGLRNQIGSENYGNGVYLWNWLSDKLQGSTMDVIHILLTDMMNMKQSEDEVFDAYKARVDRLNDRLAKAEFDTPLVLYRHLVLKLLRPEYQPIVLVIDTNSSYDIIAGKNIECWNKIVTTIRHYERTTLQKESNDNNDSSSVMAVRGNRTKYNDRKKNVTCYNCKEKGHYSNKCPNKKETSESTNVGHAKSAVSAGGDSKSSSSKNDEVENSGFLFSAIGSQQKPTYRAVVYASLKLPTAVSSVKLPTGTTAAPKLKRLIRPGESSINGSIKPAVVEVKSTGIKSKPAVQKLTADEEAHKKNLQVAKLPNAVPLIGKSLEKRLKDMTWGIDTMATIHCTGNASVFSVRKRCSPMSIMCANNESVVATQKGTVNLRVRTAKGGIITLSVTDVYYCAEIGANLLAALKL
jgi:Zinc knuckle